MPAVCGQSTQTPPAPPAGSTAAPCCACCGGHRPGCRDRPRPAPGHDRARPPKPSVRRSELGRAEQVGQLQHVDDPLPQSPPPAFDQFGQIQIVEPQRQRHDDPPPGGHRQRRPRPSSASAMRLDVSIRSSRSNSRLAAARPIASADTRRQSPDQQMPADRAQRASRRAKSAARARPARSARGRSRFDQLRLCIESQFSRSTMVCSSGGACPPRHAMRNVTAPRRCVD